MHTTPQIGYRTLALEYVQTREQWLERAAALMRESLIPQLAGHRCRVSCGWPHKAAVARLNGLLANLGPYPHAAIDKRGRKKQGTRLLKVICGAVDTRFERRNGGLIPGCLFVPVAQKWQSRIEREGETDDGRKDRTAPCAVENAEFGLNGVAPFGDHGWRPGTVIGLGKNRGDRTVVCLAFETGGKGRRVAGDLYWRKPEFKGKDKPRAEALSV